MALTGSVLTIPRVPCQLAPAGSRYQGSSALRAARALPAAGQVAELGSARLWDGGEGTSKSAGIFSATEL